MAAFYAQEGTYGTDGDFDNNANWTSASPTSGNFIVRSSSQNLDTNPDQSAHTFTSVEFASDYTGNVFATGNPLRLIGTTMRMFSGGTEAWIDGAWTDFIVDQPRRGTSNQCVVNSSNAATIAHLVGRRSNLTIGANATITLLHMNPRSHGDLLVTTSTGATITTAVVFGGIMNNNVACTTLNLAGGEWRHATGTVTTAYVGAGARLVLQSGTVTTVYVGPGGVLDLSTSTTQKRATTIWNAGLVHFGDFSNRLDTQSYRPLGGQYTGQLAEAFSMS